MKLFSLFMALVVAMAAAHAHAQDNRMEISSFENTLKDHAKAHENSWEYWGLTEQEWSRYESLKQRSPWGVWRSEATPLAILSHYSTNSVEKIRFARLEAELDQWRENTTLEFQLIYNKQREIVFAKNAALLNVRTPEVKNIKSTDRVLYFVEAGECNARCRTATTRLLGTSAHIDIFVIGAKAETDIYGWATRAKIPIDRVHVKQVTLNFENSYLAAVTTTPKSVLEFPMAFLQGKDGYKAVIF